MISLPLNIKHTHDMNVFGPVDHFRGTVWDGGACVGLLASYNRFSQILRMSTLEPGFLDRTVFSSSLFFKKKMECHKGYHCRDF